MRALFILVLLTGVALAKPTIVVAPFDGDSGNKVADVVADVAGEDAKVIGPEKAAKTMKKLELSELDSKGLIKLRAKLDADLILSGTVEKDGKSKTLELGVTEKGRPTKKFTITFKKPDTEKFKKQVREALGRKGGGGSDSNEADEEDEADEADEEDDKKKKKKQKKRRGRDDEEDDDDDDDGGDDKVKVKEKRHAVTQVAIRVWAGGSFSRRTLTNDSTATNRPPSVGTAAPSARIEGEVYPLAIDTIKGAAAGIGAFGRYEKAFGVKINVPLEPNDSAIDQSNFMLGARYRLSISAATIAVGVAYAGRKFLADRSVLGDPQALDMPDVRYRGVAPGVLARFPVTPTIGAYAGGNVVLMTATGPIQRSTSYGAADVFAFELEAGLDVAFGKNYGLHIGADFSQIGFSFKGIPGTMAAARGITKATDRTYGVVAAFAVMY